MYCTCIMTIMILSIDAAFLNKLPMACISQTNKSTHKWVTKPWYIISKTLLASVNIFEQVESLLQPIFGRIFPQSLIKVACAYQK